MIAKILIPVNAAAETRTDEKAASGPAKPRNNGAVSSLLIPALEPARRVSASR